MKVYVSKERFNSFNENEKEEFKSLFSYSPKTKAWTSRFIENIERDDYVELLDRLNLKPVIFFFPTKKQYNNYDENTKEAIRTNFVFNRQLSGWESRPGKEQDAYDILTILGSPKCISLNEALKVQLNNAALEINTSESYFEYLKTMSRFTQYSPHNIMYIAAQNPNATLIAGRTQWIKMGRKINADAKGLYILAPKIGERTINVDNLSESIKKRYKIPTDAHGVKNVKIVTGFSTVIVYDISETNGKPLPQRPLESIPKLLNGKVHNFNELKAAIEQTAVPYSVEYVDNLGGANGICIPSKKIIKILNTLSEEQTIKTLLHETAHSRLHDSDSSLFVLLPRSAEEVQAESVAFICCRHLGIDSSDYSNGYVATWSFKNPRDTLDLITSAAEHSHKLCAIIDKNYRDILKETEDIENEPDKEKMLNDNRVQSQDSNEIQIYEHRMEMTIV